MLVWCEMLVVALPLPQGCGWQNGCTPTPFWLPDCAQLAMAEATEEKERGNKLFGAKKFKEAIKSFTRCIELDSRWG